MMGRLFYGLLYPPVSLTATKRQSARSTGGCREPIKRFPDSQLRRWTMARCPSLVVLDSAVAER